MKVVYLVGNGRSGTTLMSALLGADPTFINVGEVSSAHVSLSEDLHCSCGNPISRCNMWSSIIKSYVKKTGDDCISRYRRLNRLYEHNIGEVWNLSIRRNFSDYQSLNIKMLDTISKQTGASTIVDSSKLWARAVLLSRCNRTNMRFIQFVRDPRGIVWSLIPRKDRQKKSKFGIDYFSNSRLMWKLSSWISQNVITQTLHTCGWINPLIRVRIEDVLSNQEKCVKNLCDYAGAEFAQVYSNTNAFDSVNVGHIFSGNPSISSRASISLGGRSTIEEWRGKFTTALDRLIMTYTYPVSYSFGYSYR